MSNYVIDRPVAEHPSFLGRDVLLKSLTDALARSRVFICLGGPKTGRTSLVDKLVNRSREVLRQPGQNAAKQVVVRVDVQGLGSATAVQLVQAMWTALQTAVLDPFVQNHPSPPRPQKIEIRRNQEPWEIFDAASQTLWSQLQNTPGWCRYALIFDNAETLAEPGWYATLTELVKRVSATEGGRPQALGLVGGFGLRAALAPHKKVLRTARLHVLEPLRAADVQSLGRLGDLDLPAIDTAFASFGGHPYLLQQAMAAIEAQPEADPIELCQALAQSCAPYFETLIAAWPGPARGTGVDPERSLLAWLTQHSGEGDAAQAEAELNLGPLRAACDTLVGSGILDRSVRGGSGTWLRLNVGAFNQWATETQNL